MIGLGSCFVRQDTRSAFVSLSSMSRENRDRTIHGVANQLRLRLEPRLRLEDRRLRSGQDDVAESVERRNAPSRRQVHDLRLAPLQMCLPVPRGLEQESMHRVVDDEDAWWHGGSIAEPVRRARVEWIINPPVEGVQRWFRVEAPVVADIEPGERRPPFSLRLDGISRCQLP